MPDEADEPLCDRDGCEEIARYVETGDGHALPDPRLRCHDHKPRTGLWRDMAPAIASAYGPVSRLRRDGE